MAPSSRQGRRTGSDWAPQQDIRRSERCILIINARRSSGKDKALRIEGFYFFPGSIICNQLTIHIAFSDAARNQQTVLRTKIHNYYGLMFGDRCSFLGSDRFSTYFFGDFKVSGDFDITTGGYPVDINIRILFNFSFSHKSISLFSQLQHGHLASEASAFIESFG